MAAMAERAHLVRVEPGPTLPAFERLAPAPHHDVLVAQIEAHTAPGDVVVDLHGRGGWVARAAVDCQRRAVSLETSSLGRLLAEIVLRPPDLRHLEAAFQAIAAAPRRETSLKVSIGDLFATRCATCERTTVADELIWERSADDPGAAPRPIRKHYRCVVCRDQRGGGEHRHAPPDDDDLARARADDAMVGVEVYRRQLRDRFPVLEGGEGLIDQLLGLHTPRQLVGLAAILERIESDLRAAPVEAALRAALLHALHPASRLNAHPGRVATLRIHNGRMRQPSSAQWRERNPWLAFEDGYRLVRGFVQRLEGGTSGPVQARIGEDVRSLVDGPATASLRLGTASAFRALGAEADALARLGGRPKVRLVLSEPPLRPSPERLAFAYHAAAWVLGREAAALLPLGTLFGSAPRVPWGWQAAAVRRSLEAVEPLLARDGRAVLLVEEGPEALAAAALGGAGAGYRLVSARLAELGGEERGVVAFVPPGAAVPPGPRTRANVPLPPVSGGPGDPGLVPGRGLFAPPERYDRRPFSAAEAARTVTETAVEVLRTRGEPARIEQLLGEVLVGLDRAGLLRRLAGAEGGKGAEGAPTRAAEGGPMPAAEGAPTRAGDEQVVASDPVDRLVAIVRGELTRPTQRRLVEVAPGCWWLADRSDRDTAAPPLADRVEWAVYSLLSTGGPLSERVFFERIAGLFTGPDLPDETLVRACLESYRSLASTPERLVTNDDLLRRSNEHTELLALLADVGHRMGMSVWLGEREQGRRVGARWLAGWLDERERSAYLGWITRAPADILAEVDAIWYVRGKAAFLFEVEWTAMLGETVLKRHARIPTDERTVRFLVVAPERTELLRHKLDRSPILRAALEGGNWHVLKWDHLREFAALRTPSLDALEPFLGLDPLAERTGEQLPLFGG